VTNIGAAAASLSRKKHLLARDPAAKRMFSVRKRSANVAAANVLSVRKRSDSNNKAPSRNGNQPHVIVPNHKFPNTVYILHMAPIFLVKKHESQHVDSCFLL